MTSRFAALVTTLFFVLQAQAAFDSDLLAGLQARNIGPAAVGGRITAIDVIASRPDHILIGTATGGVWMSDNAGLTWHPVFDDQPVASIGAVAFNQSNPDIIWVGTGEGNVRNSTSIGAGIFKSIDGGRSWNRVGLEATERINRIAVHPDDPDVVYAAALGTLWGENTERGIFRTSDGGASWEKVLYVDEKTGATDVKLDPFNPDKVYASMWQHRRWPWFFKSGGPSSGLYVSWDGGQTWARKTEDDGLPAGGLGRITIAPSPAQKGRVYALVEAEKSAMVRSDDGGQSWQKVNQEPNIAVRPFYYTEVAADPFDANRVYNIYTRLGVSIDGGKTFELNPVIDCCAAGNTIHIDNHAFWINPNDPRHLIIGNDGGIAISRDRGETWRFVRNLPLSQFYHVAVDNDRPYNVYGGLQDNGSWRGPSEVWENAGIRNLHWQETGFGDGFDTLPDPENPRQGYSMSQTGYLYRWNLDTGEQRYIRPAPSASDVELRFNWDSALAQDPFDPATIYYGSQFVHKSVDRGETWSVISPDLTSNDPDKQIYSESGGLTPDVTGAENYTTLTVIAPSPIEQGLIWTGSDDGRVHVSRNGGQEWNRVDSGARGVNPGAWVHFIYPSPHEAGTAFVAFDDHRRSDMTAYFYRVEDYGQDWTRIGADLPGYALSIVQDHVDPNLLFAGTEFGLHVSTDGGETWTAFRAGVPTVSVMDMAIQQREDALVLGTHGRGIFVIDDYSSLRGLEAGKFSDRLAILTTTEGLQYDPRQTPSTRFTGSGEFRAENRPVGVIVTYMASGADLPHPNPDLEKQRRIRQRDTAALNREDEDEDIASDDKGSKATKVKVEVYDSDGTLIRTFTREVQQGINRFNWDLRDDDVRPMPAAQPRDPEEDLPSGARVPAGQYRLALTLQNGDEEQVSDDATVTVVADPRTGFTPNQRKENYEALLDLQALQLQAVEAVEQIVEARKDLDTIDEIMARRANGGDESSKALKEQGAEVRKSLNELEQTFRVPPDTKGAVADDSKIVNQIGLAEGYVSSSLGAPSGTALLYIQRAQEATNAALEQLQEVFSEQVEPYRQAVDAAGIRLLSTSR
jgi:photosystem II stability/assembly factor-like uncharacterized protein